MRPTVFAWRWVRNFDRTLRYRLNNRLDDGLSADVKELQSEGLIARSPEAVFDQTGFLDEVVAVIDGKLREDHVQAALRNRHSGVQKKEYRLHLLPQEFDVHSPVIQLAIQPRLLALINGYLGLRSFLRAVVTWLDFPTPGPAKETQLWHRDTDDTLNIKVFIYLTEVGEEAGPFCFIPRTHPLGNYRVNVPVDVPGGRISDEAMAKIVPPTYWKVCTGPARRVLLVDTTGYHKGLKPVAKHRVLLQFHYTSGQPRFPRDFTLKGRIDGSLTDDQKYALFG